MIKPDTAAAIDFLEKYEAGGPWVLTSIAPDRKGVSTATFTDAAAATKWIDEYNGNRNIYFHVNPTIGSVKLKAKREQIKSLSWLHVDIDPRAGEDLDDERVRCLGLLSEKLPKGVPEPTITLFSGGGYQAFWKLQEPFLIDGDEDKYEEAKLWNLQLELAFDADNCHNVDRIMRLPGTINMPDARKKKKGRKPELAELLTFKPENVYPLAKFTKAVAIQTATSGGFTGGKSTPQVAIGDNIERVLDLDELNEWEVTDAVKRIIAQGSDPMDMKPERKSWSRSEWMLWVTAECARKGVPPETVYAIITDPEWPISESVLEHKGNAAHKYALRQVQRGIEYAVSPILDEFNNEFAVIETLGGRCRIIQEVMDVVLKRPHLAIQSFGDFQNRFMNRQVEVGTDANGLPKYMEAGKWWLKHEKRRQFTMVTFAPGHEVANAYNLWRGFAVDALPGECGKFLAHVKDNICQGNQEHFDYLMGWTARMIQQPDTPGEVAVVMRGGRGTGKSFFANQLGKLLGRHYLAVSNGSHLTGNFNSHLRDLVLLFADEAFYANDKKHTSILKTLITEPTLTIERKGVDVENAPNFIHLIMASNDEHVVPAGDRERRFFVLDVGEGQQQNSKYFQAIAEEMDNGGREALLHWLMNHDISDFHVRAVPQTKALRDQQIMSLSPEAEWWYHKLRTGSLVWNKGGWPQYIVNEDIVEDYVDNTKRFHSYGKASQTILGVFLKSHWPFIRNTRKTVDRERQTSDGFTTVKKERMPVRIVPSLEECRELWETMYGETDWDLEIEDTAPLVDDQSPF